MKKRVNMLKIYVEAIIYSICLVIAIFLCLSENLYITMFPIAFLVGIIGQVLFGKRVMTSFFCVILSIVLLQIRTPALLTENLTQSLEILILVLLGEGFGWAIKRYFRLAKKKKNIAKKIKIEKIKCLGISGLVLILGLICSSVFNGNYISYNIAKNSLKNYFIEEYHSSSRFEIVTSKYVFSKNAKYVFYTKDTMASNVLGKFNVYIKDNYNVQDEYEEQIANRISNKINEDINNINGFDDIQIYVTNTEFNELTICFRKQVESVTKEQIETYSKDIAMYLNMAKNIENFNEIKQIKVMLEGKSNPKDNVASYIYMTGYNEMIKNNTEQAYEYIMRALNIEYFD